MKRDFALIRDILLECEKSDERWFSIGIMEAGDWEPSLKTDFDKHHLLQIDLMVDAGLIRKENLAHPGLSGPEVAEVMYEISFAGYDYLDAIRDDGIWNKTKQVVAETGGSATLDIVKSLAVGFLKTKIEKHTGIAL